MWRISALVLAAALPQPRGGNGAGGGDAIMSLRGHRGCFIEAGFLVWSAWGRSCDSVFPQSCAAGEHAEICAARCSVKQLLLLQITSSLTFREKMLICSHAETLSHSPVANKVIFPNLQTGLLLYTNDKMKRWLHVCLLDAVANSCQLCLPPTQTPE